MIAPAGPVRVTSLADISALPWAGNFADDSPLIDLVDAFIRAAPDLKTRQAATKLVTELAYGESMEGYYEQHPDDDPLNYY